MTGSVRVSEHGGWLRTPTALILVFSVIISGCATVETRQSTSVVDYLFPEGNQPMAEQGSTVLNLPMRVGIGFVPDTPGRSPGFLTEARKRQLLEQVASHFRDRDFVRTIDIVPSAYFRPGGGFQNLDQIRTMYGLDVIALVSYDQTQFTDESRMSIAYWTLVGAYFVRGEKNSTHTMVDAVVLDVPSRRMLFRAPGTSFVRGRATPVNLAEALREDAGRGFDEAVAEMILNLEQELVSFQDRVQQSPGDFQLVAGPDYRGGAGALPAWVPLLFLILLVGAALRSSRRCG